MKNKTCNKCGIEFPCNEEYFYKKKTSKDGLTGQCKTCILKRTDLYYKANKEKINRRYQANKNKNIERCMNYNKVNKNAISEYNKKRYLDNKEIIREKQTKFRQDNKEKFIEYEKQHYQNNKSHILERQKQYYQLNSDKRIAISERRRTRKMLLPSTLTTEQWNNIKLYFGNECAYCGEKKPLAQEHFLALSKGGEYTVNNIIPSCKSCNSSKGNKDFFEWYPRYKFYNKKRKEKILKFLNYKNNTQQLALTV